MDLIKNVNILKEALDDHVYEANFNVPNQLFCYRKITDELLVVTQGKKGQKSKEGETGLFLTTIHMPALKEDLEGDFKLEEYVKTVPIVYEGTVEEGESESGGRVRTPDVKLTEKLAPNKIFMNVRGNALIIVSQHWVGIVSLYNDFSGIDDLFCAELQLIGLRNDPDRIDTSEVFLDVKFHPLSPYTICILNQRNNFKMYDVSVSIDNPFTDLNLSPSSNDAGRRLQKKDWGIPSTKYSKIMGFDFGSRTVLGWQALTCYFITLKGEIYYITPCLPIKFSIEKVFFEKLMEREIDKKETLELLTILDMKKEPITADRSLSLVTLSESDLLRFTPVLQGPVNNPLLDIKAGFDGLISLNTYPQVFVSHSLRNEAYVQVSFEDPCPNFDSKFPVEPITWTVKECIDLCINEDDNPDLINSFQISDLDPYTLYFLRGRYFTKIYFPWLADISRQLKKNNFESNDFEYNKDKLTEVKVLFEFSNDKTCCIGIQILDDFLFTMRNFSTKDKTNSNVCLRSTSLNEREYNEIREKIEEINANHPDIDEVISMNKEQLKDCRVDDFKLPNYKQIPIKGTNEKLTEKEFLKQFTLSCKAFGENVVTETEEHAKIIKAKKEHLERLKKFCKEKETEIQAKLLQIKDKKSQTSDISKKIMQNESDINTKLEGIVEKLRNKISAPLTANEEQLLLKMDEVEDRTIQIRKNLEVQTEEFKDERNKEKEIMKGYKCKFTKEEIESQIKPQIRKLVNIRKDLENFRLRLDELN